MKIYSNYISKETMEKGFLQEPLNKINKSEF